MRALEEIEIPPASVEELIDVVRGMEPETSRRILTNGLRIHIAEQDRATDERSRAHRRRNRGERFRALLGRLRLVR